MGLGPTDPQTYLGPLDPPSYPAIAAYDTANLPPELQSIGFLVGRWRSEFGGKAKFPTIPVFTYGEQIDFTISEKPVFGLRSLNYT